MTFLKRLFAAINKTEHIDSKKANLSEEITECIKCGGQNFEHDSHWDEYNCENCGWTSKEKPKGKVNIKELYAKKNENSSTQNSISTGSLANTESKSKVKNEVKDALNSFYAIDESKELGIFILKHKKDILLNVIKAIDIRSMPVKKDSPGMRGMQCMKLLEASRELRDFDRKDEMRVCYEKLMELCETEWQEDNIGVYSQVMIGVGKDLMQDTSEPKLVFENMKKAYNAFGSLNSHGLENADAIAWQGACSFNLGEEDKARSSLEQALRIEPSHKLANDLAQKLGLDVAVSETKGKNELDFLKDLLASDPDPASFYKEIDKWGFKASEHAAFGSTYKGKSGALVFFASKSAGRIINAKYSDNKTREIINLVE